MRIQLLGPLLLDGRDGTAVVPAAKQRLLLAALALRARHVVSFEELADAAWGDDASRAARVTVRNYMLRLRRVLGDDGPRIVTRDPGYLLDVADGDVDALTFDSQCEAGAGLARAGQWGEAAETLHEALRMWRGTPLADVPSGRLRDHWARYLEQVRLRALRHRIHADLQVGRHEAVTSELRALTASYPLDERLWELLLLALYRSGQQGGALAAYRQARATLVAELGVEPGPDLRRLHEQALAHDPSLDIPAAPAALAGRKAPPVPRQLPAALPVFAGRSRELELLDNLLDEATRDGATAMVFAIGGTAGVGKTALAVHFAHRVAARFPDGQLYVNLRGFHPSGEPVTPEQAIRGFLDALGMPADRIPADVDAQAALLRTLLAGRRMLVLLDNARDAAQARPLLPGLPGCLVVVTSRDPLASLAVTEGARLLHLDLPTEPEARDLLAARLGIAAVAADPDAVAELIGWCARLPLALAVVAGRAAIRPGFSLRALAAELRAEQDLLSQLDAGEELVSVRAVFRWSYRQLTETAAWLFRMLGVHPGPDITAPAAASMAGVPITQSRAALRELTTVGLLTEHLPGRYAFHDLLRGYASELASAVDEREGRRLAVHRALDHYLQTAYAAALQLRPARLTISLAPPVAGVSPEELADREQAMAWLAAEQQVLIAAVDLACDTGHDVHGWQIPWAMSDFLGWRGHWREQTALQRIAVTAAVRLGDIAGQAVSLRLAAETYTIRGESDLAVRYFADCVDLYEQVGDQGSVARVHLSLAWLADRQGDYVESLGHAEQALQLFRAIGHEAGQASALNGIGWCHARLGQYERARESSQQSVMLHARLDSPAPRDYASALDGLGHAEYKLGNYTAAIDCHLRAVRLCREVGDGYAEGDILTNLGDAYQATGDTHAAREAWQQAVDVLTGLDHPDAAKARARLDGMGGPAAGTGG